MDERRTGRDQRDGGVVRTDADTTAGLTVDAHADGIAARVDNEAASFRQAIGPVAAEYEALLRRIAQTAPEYAFDRAGRPFATEAVREALPAVERELFDAILEDFACERAAIEEGLYRVALAVARRGSR